MENLKQIQTTEEALAQIKTQLEESTSELNRIHLKAPDMIVKQHLFGGAGLQEVLLERQWHSFVCETYPAAAEALIQRIADECRENARLEATRLKAETRGAYFKLRDEVIASNEIPGATVRCKLEKLAYRKDDLERELTKILHEIDLFDAQRNRGDKFSYQGLITE